MRSMTTPHHITHTTSPTPHHPHHIAHIAHTASRLPPRRLKDINQQNEAELTVMKVTLVDKDEQLQQALFTNDLVQRKYESAQKQLDVSLKNPVCFIPPPSPFTLGRSRFRRPMPWMLWLRTARTLVAYHHIECIDVIPVQSRQSRLRVPCRPRARRPWRIEMQAHCRPRLRRMPTRAFPTCPSACAHCTTLSFSTPRKVCQACFYVRQ